MPTPTQRWGANPVDNADSSTVASGGSVIAGSTIVVVAFGWRSAAAFTVPDGSVTDDKGNTYHRLVESTAQSNCVVSIHYAENVAAGVTSVTVDPTGTANYFSWAAFEIAAPSSSHDVSAANNSGTSGASGNPGTTGSTAQADEFVVMAVTTVSDPTTITVQSASPAFTEDTEQLDGSTHQAGEIDYRVVSAVGAQTGGWDFVGSNTYSAAIGTFKLTSSVTGYTPGQDGDYRHLLG